MRRMLIAIAGTGLVGLALVAAPQAGAQSQEDLCAGFQELIDMGMGTPFEPIAQGGQQLKDQACAEDDGGGGDDDEPNPVCAAIEETLANLEAGGAPAELTDPLRELIAQGCPPEEEPTTTTTAAAPTTTSPPPTTTTTTAPPGVAGEQGTALPVTGAPLLAAGLGGASLLGLAALARRLLGH